MSPELQLVKLSPTADSRLRWADGSLKGVKMLRFFKGEVQSPHHRTTWPGAQLDALGWADGDAVRNKGGIHAIWPPGVDDDNKAFAEWQQYAPQRKDEFTVLVQGWGRSIMGDVGWRAEHVKLRSIISPPRSGAYKLRQWCREHGVNWSVL